MSSKTLNSRFTNYGRFNPPLQKPIIVKRSVKKSKTKNKTSDYDFFLAVYAAVLNALKKPPVLISIIVISALIYSHEFDSKSSHLNLLIKKLSENSSTATFGTWISKNLKKSYGLFMLVPLFFEAPKNYRVLLTLGMAAFIVITTPLHYFYYIIINLALFLYIKFTNQSHKFVVIMLLVVTYLFTTTVVPATKTDDTTPAPPPPPNTTK